MTLHVGVLGAGTMGSGIALTALQSGARVTLYDVASAALSKARDYCQTFLTKRNNAAAIEQLRLADSLEMFASCDIVIEAALEKIELKREMFGALERVCAPSCIFASNTSTLSVTEIAASTQSPERVIGMHFFNPAPLMPLVEVVRGLRTREDVVQNTVALARQFNKTPVIARDTPGFIVNRVARPFYLEACRLLQEGVATHEQIDRLAQMGAGFKMGPFQLMDLIGIDINFSAAKSLYEQTFGEPRFRPSLIQAQMVQAGALGRKSGKGFYSYAPDAAPFSLPAVPVAQRALNAEQLTQLDEPHLPRFVDVTTQTLAHSGDVTRSVGFDGMFWNGAAVSLVGHKNLRADMRAATEQFMASLGKHVEWVPDSPALALPRIVCQLINEAAFAAGEGVAEPDTIDTAMRLGVNYPKGLFAWARELGVSRVVAVLDHLRAFYGEERYRVAPLLRQM